MAVVIFAEDEHDALHVKLADESYSLGNGSLAETYLNIEKIIQIAQESGCDAIHPGYGFLSENEAFAQACDQCGISFIGPSAKAIKLMGNKVEARALATAAGVPVLHAYTGSAEELISQKETFDYPVLIKAAAGGGGKGMRKVHEMTDFESALRTTIREATNYFGNGQVFIERYIEHPRHIEIQVLGDKAGNVIHLFERECTLQRRHQKIIEEAPSISINEETRSKITEAAISLAQKVGYYSAGTVEFLVDENQQFYFLEMNTRIQVEHPVTEFITGVDIVMEQIRIAEGKVLSIQQKDIHINGHAIECRLYAEDPSNDFMPAPGFLNAVHFPIRPRVRIDACCDAPAMIQSHYDPMLAKVIVHGEHRDTGISSMIETLQQTVLTGIMTNQSFLITLLRSDDFHQNIISTHYIDDHLDELNKQQLDLGARLPLAYLCAAVLFVKCSGREGEGGMNVWQEIGYWRALRAANLQIEGEEVIVNDIFLRGNRINFVLNQTSFEIKVMKTAQYLLLQYDTQQFRIFISRDDKGMYICVVNGFVYHIDTSDNLLSRQFAEVKSFEMQEESIFSPMPGNVLQVMRKQGESVMAGDPILVVEAMKMENTIKSKIAGKVKAIYVKQGQQVDKDQLLVELASDEK